ncbi:unnamed protein product [Chrysodeixis includens]|uniref:NADH dehydrogenase [ubiquinone] 1 beta subcomplex subunit 11, mitochondrial n=1 Tax=Chrysodeixis includens TaxID=689277 RepID=A0A9P0BZ17_CHRIL|nr:unnamed protein product [Chrysodeixis includens]
MAGIIKFRNMPIMQRCVWNHINTMSRNISTKKTSDNATTTAPPPCKDEEKNWVSYGFDYNSHREDTNVHNASFFFSVTLCLVFGGFAWAYAPDTHLRDWAQREAFLELRRREKAGLRPIDPNFIEPHKMNLPSDEEICNLSTII